MLAVAILVAVLYIALLPEQKKGRYVDVKIDPNYGKMVTVSGVPNWYVREKYPDVMRLEAFGGGLFRISRPPSGGVKLESVHERDIQIRFWWKWITLAATILLLCLSINYGFLIARTFTWSGSGNRDVPANWDKGTELGSTQPTPTGHSTDAGGGQPSMQKSVRTSTDRMIAGAIDSATNDLVVYYTDDDWTSSTRVVVDSVNNHNEFSVAIDSSDNIFIFSRATSTLLLHRSTDNGASWSISTDIAAGESGTPDQFNMVLIDNDDFLHFLWRTTSSADLLYCVSDTASPDPTAFNSGGTPWDIESYKGAADSTTESVDSGYSWTSNVQMDACLFDDGSDNVAVVWDNTPTQSEVRFRKKADNEAWSSAGANVQVDTGGNTHFPGIAVANDDSTFAVGYKFGLDPHLKGSADGGATWSSRVSLSTTNVNGSAVTFDGDYFWHTTESGTASWWTQFSVNTSTGAVTVIDGFNNIDGTVPSNSQRGATIRWQRFHHNSPTKIDVVYRDSTTNDMEVMVLAPQVPGAEDDCVFDTTSTSSCTWNDTSPVKSLTVNSGYGSTISGTSHIETTGDITVNDTSGLLLAQDGVTVGGNFNTTASGYSVSLEDTNTISGTLTVATGVTFTLNALSGNCILACDTVVNGSTSFRFQNHGTNTVILRGITQKQSWDSNEPDWDFTSSGNVDCGTGATFGVDFATNSLAVNFGTADVTLQDNCSFNAITYLASGNLTSATGTSHELGGNLTRNSGDFFPNDSTWTCTVNLSLNGTTFYDLVINDGVTVTLGNDIEIENTLDLNSTGVLDYNGFDVRWSGAGPFVSGNASGRTDTAGGSKDILFPTGSSQSVDGRTDWQDIQFQPDVVSTTWTQAGPVTCKGFGFGTEMSGMVWDTNNNALQVNGNVQGGATSITLDLTSITMTVSGNCNFSGWTLTLSSSNLNLNGSSPQTFTTNGSADVFTNLDWLATSDVTLGSDVYFSGIVNAVGNGDVLTNAFDMYLRQNTGTPWTGTSAMNDFSAWTGSVIYSPSSAVQNANIGGYYPGLKVEATAAGSSQVDFVASATAQAVVWGDGTNAITISHTGGFDITCTTLFVSEDAKYEGYSASSPGDVTITLSAAMTIEGDFECISTTNQTDLVATGITVTSNGPGSGIFEFTDTNNNGSSISLGGGLMQCGASTSIVMRGQDAVNQLSFTGSLQSDVADTFEIQYFSLIQSVSGPTYGLIINGDHGSTTSFFIRDSAFQQTAGAAEAVRFVGGPWIMAATNFIERTGFDDVNMAAASLIWMTDCVVADCSNPSGGKLFVYGTALAGNTEADIWGPIDAVADPLLSLASGSRDVVNVRAPTSGIATSITVPSNLTVESWMHDAATTLAVSGSTTFQMNANSTLAATNIAVNAVVRFANSTGQLDIIDDVTADNGTFRVDVECTVRMLDGTEIIVQNTGFLDIDGPSATSRVTFTRNSISGTRPNIRIPSGALSAEAVLIRNVRMTDYGESGGNGAIEANGSSIGLLDNVELINCPGYAINMDLTTATSYYVIQGCMAKNCGVGLRLSADHELMEVRDVRILDSTIGLEVQGTLVYQGTIKGVRAPKCSSYGLQWSAPTPGATHILEDCVFHGDTNDINIIGSPVLKMSNCILSEKLIGNQVSPGTGSWNVVAFNYNRENRKKVRIFNNLVVDSSFFSNIHSDTFDWDGFTIAADGANYVVSTPPTTPITAPITVPSSTLIYVSVTGDITDDDWTITQNLTSGGPVSTVVTGGNTSTTLTTDALVANLQVFFSNGSGGEILSNIEVRLTNASGDLIWNDDLINKYKSPGSEWNYSAGESAFAIEQDSPGTAILPFGDAGPLKEIDYEIDLPTMVSGRSGVVFGRQNASNYYEAYLDSTDTLTVRKIVAGSPVVIDTATTFGAGANTIDVSLNAYKIRVLRHLTATSPSDTPTATSDVIQVWLNDVLVEASDWVTEATNDYLTDATFETGHFGLVSESGNNLDNMSIDHCGFWLRDADIIFNGSLTFTVQSTGKVFIADVSMNISENLFINNGGDVTLIDVTFTDTDFDESVSGVTTLECAKLKVTTDVQLEPDGQLNMTGCVMEFDPPQNYAYRIITDFSLVDPPINVVGCRFYGVIPRLRALDGSDAPYELDLSIPEVVLAGPEDIHDVNVASNAVFGLDSHRNIATGQSDRETTIGFFVKDDMCLFGKVSKYRDNDTPVEFIWARGILYNVRIVRVDPVFAQDENLRLVRFFVTFQGGFLD